MEPKDLSDTIRMLVDRMQTHSEEFINEKWDPIQMNAWDDEPFNNVRWSNLMRAFYQSGKEFIFDKEEIDFVQNNYRKALRNRVDECILKELVANERQEAIDFRNKQMELPYTTSFTAAKQVKTKSQKSQEILDAYLKYKKGMTG